MCLARFRGVELMIAIDGWKEKYMGLHNGTIKDKQLLDFSVNVPKSFRGRLNMWTEVRVEMLRIQVDNLAIGQVKTPNVLTISRLASHALPVHFPIVAH